MQGAGITRAVISSLRQSDECVQLEGMSIVMGL